MLWSARFLFSNPDLIKEMHDRFIISGADIITTATYQASIPGFVSHLGLSVGDSRKLLMSGVYLAKEAAEKRSDLKWRKSAFVAGSVGPYGAHLANGSEYKGTYAARLTVERLKDFHRPHIECLVDAGADVIAFETIPSIKECQALVEVLREFPSSEAWMSFSCGDHKTIADGSLFTDAVQMACRSKQLLAVGVNCCPPDVVEPLLDAAQSLLPPEMTWVAYPNKWDAWDTKLGWLSGKPAAWLPDLSHKWIKQGVGLIGGCCFVRPADIAWLRQHLKGDDAKCEPNDCPTTESTS
ncbi:homocysteine S-methyltransferase 1 isoform X2 [Salarias fasciatus]|nr:homocysteine S-methyltransferase 1-like isoform X2 [Salarias fasciatus]